MRATPPNDSATTKTQHRLICEHHTPSTTMIKRLNFREGSELGGRRWRWEDTHFGHLAMIRHIPYTLIPGVDSLLDGLIVCHQRTHRSLILLMVHPHRCARPRLRLVIVIRAVMPQPLSKSFKCRWMFTTHFALRIPSRQITSLYRLLSVMILTSVSYQDAHCKDLCFERFVTTNLY
ncbi:hypothetical protein CPB85DRAFT_373471 [Mucidula mucida]|nr:hypothetical protein CPB85DRAFT_373471 [Mucidula mucida]